VTVKLTVSQTVPERARADTLVVGLYAGRRPGPGSGLIAREALALLDAAGFEGKVGETAVVSAAGVAAKRIVVAGLGTAAELRADTFRSVGAAIARRSRKSRSVATTVLSSLPKRIDAGDAAQALAEGVVLGGYQYLKYKSDAERSVLASVAVLGSAAKAAGGLTAGATVASAVLAARDLVNEPAAGKSPAQFAAEAQRVARRSGLKCTVYAGPQLERLRLNGTITVGMGSHRGPRFVKLEYVPRGARTTLGLVGKGVVFDSGGLSLKPSAGMEQMKTDMSGGAAVLSAMSVLGTLGVRTRVVGYVPLVENMPSGTAYRLGDVIRYRNDKTVEVMNTDAEGRLILADALALAADEGVDAMVDVATLTGACMVALGNQIAGLMGNHDGWIEQVRAAADRVGEKVWPLPLPREYRKLLDSEIADMKNVGGQYGGALTAGLFLQEFVGDVPWVHLDIAGPARSESDNGINVKGGSGFGVRTLVELAQHFRKPGRA
jgi:leucyl aminopeptidase